MSKSGRFWESEKNYSMEPISPISVFEFGLNDKINQKVEFLLAC